MKISISLESAGCAKPNCKHKFTPTHRHHMASEKQWINLYNRPGTVPFFRGDLERGRRLLRLLRERYFAFRPKDVVRLCAWHHVEIHQHYKRIVRELAFSLRSPIDHFSFEHAIQAMRLCRKFCLEWLKTETPGIDPKFAEKLGRWGKKP